VLSLMDSSWWPTSLGTLSLLVLDNEESPTSQEYNPGHFAKITCLKISFHSHSVL
jgi:hypothetical protein